MPKLESTSNPPHRKSAPSPYSRNNKDTRKLSNKSNKSNKEEEDQKKESKLNSLENLKNEIKNEFPKLHLESQAPPPKPDKKNKKKKKKRKSITGNNDNNTPQKLSVEDQITARIEKSKKEKEKLDSVKLVNEIKDLYSNDKSISSSLESGSQHTALEDADVNMDENEDTSNAIPPTPMTKRHRSSESPTKVPITSTETEKSRRKAQKEKISQFLSSEKSRLEEENQEEDRRKQRELASRIAKENLEKIQQETEKIKSELSSLQAQKNKIEELEKSKKVKLDEDKKRQSDKELAKVREEKKKFKDLQDKFEAAENERDSWKLKFDNAISENELKQKDNEKIIEVLKKSDEEKTQKIDSNTGVITNHENTKKAVIHALECAICLSTVDDPYVLSCGHMACKGCLVDWFRSPNALKHEHYGEITPETDLSYRTKLCYVCRSTILRKPARAFFLRAVLEPLGLFEHQDPPTSQTPDPWERIFPIESETYKLYDENIEKCPKCLGEIVDGVCEGCNIEFSDGSNLGDLDFDEEVEEEVIGSELGDDDIIRIDGPALGFIDDIADHDSESDDDTSTTENSRNSSSSSSSTESSSDEDGNMGHSNNGSQGRLQTARRTGGPPGSQLLPQPHQRLNLPPPPPPPALNNLLNLLADQSDDGYDSAEDSEEQEREPNSEDEYGGSFIDDGGDEDEEIDELDDDDDVNMKGDDGVGSELDEVDHAPPRRGRKTNSRIIDPDDEDDEPVFTHTKRRPATIVLSDSE